MSVRWLVVYVQSALVSSCGGPGFNSRPSQAKFSTSWFLPCCQRTDVGRIFVFRITETSHIWLSIFLHRLVPGCLTSHWNETRHLKITNSDMILNGWTNGDRKIWLVIDAGNWSNTKIYFSKRSNCEIVVLLSVTNASMVSMYGLQQYQKDWYQNVISLDIYECPWTSSVCQLI